MANAKKCDKCNKFYSPYEVGMRKRVGATYSPTNSVAFCDDALRFSFRLDLCPECLKNAVDYFGISIDQYNPSELEDAQ